MTEHPLTEEYLASEPRDPEVAFLPSGGYRRSLQTLFHGQITGAAIALVIRQAVVMVLSVGSSIAVARWLGPEIVGRFAILIFLTQGVLGYFGDLGLKAALIRKHGDLEDLELATAYKLVFILSLSLAACVAAVLPLLLPLFRLGRESYAPAFVLLLLLVLRNLRLVPLAKLERSMRFRAVSTIEATEAAIYTIVLATLAYHHAGVWAFVVAMACRDVFGSTVFNVIGRHSLRSFSWRSIQPHVNFSLLYQGASLLNMATVAFPTIVLARLVGRTEVGYASWASNLSLYPLLICNSLARMYLPAFASARSEPGSLPRLVEKALRVNATIAFPACAVLTSLSTPIIIHIFTAKWVPAIPLVYAYCLAAVLSAIGIPLTELFFSQDDARFNFRLSLLWAILTWTVGLIFVHRFGYLGFAVFYAALQATWLLAFRHARRLPGLRLWQAVREPVFFSAVLFMLNVGVQKLVRAPLGSWQLALLLFFDGLACAWMALRALLALRKTVTPMVTPVVEGAA